MCGVVGIVSKNIIPTDIIEKLILQSKIRGQHATGISYVDNDLLKTEKIAKNATFLNVKNINTRCLIAHTRYSTSSLEHNQPIAYDDLAVVHNGVITQEDSSHWDKYDYDFQTKNDSEFIIKSFLKKSHPVSDYVEASISAIVINNQTKELHFFRNEKRPLYYCYEDDMFVMASTKDILFRSGFEKVNKCRCCVNYTIKNNQISYYEIREVTTDLQ